MVCFAPSSLTTIPFSTFNGNGTLNTVVEPSPVNSRNGPLYPLLFSLKPTTLDRPKENFFGSYFTKQNFILQIDIFLPREGGDKFGWQMKNIFKI